MPVVSFLGGFQEAFPDFSKLAHALAPFCHFFLSPWIACLGCIAWGQQFNYFLCFCWCLGCAAWGDLRQALLSFLAWFGGRKKKKKKKKKQERRKKEERRKKKEERRKKKEERKKEERKKKERKKKERKKKERKKKEERKKGETFAPAKPATNRAQGFHSPFRAPPPHSDIHIESKYVHAC